MQRHVWASHMLEACLLHAAVQVEGGCELGGVRAALGALLELRKEPPVAEQWERPVSNACIVLEAHLSPFYQQKTVVYRRMMADSIPGISSKGLPDVGDDGQLRDVGIDAEQPLAEGADAEEALQRGVHVARVAQVVQA